jgi:tRNA-(ms[2]io[6]A)-hydroxylase
VDTLLVGALIEARSCERFAALAPHLDSELREFYQSLLRSEARHFTDYLKLAEQLSSAQEVAERLGLLKVEEARLIESADLEFRFHSGVPAAR